MNPERFARKTHRRGACLIWEGKGRVGPYGTAGYRGQQWLAHRLAYHFATGEELGPEDVIRHSCDTPLCVEPDHLSKGTHADNAADKVARLRQQYGERHPSARLTATDVAAIREEAAAGIMQKALAEAFGVSKQQISRIVRGERWKVSTKR